MRQHCDDNADHCESNELYQAIPPVIAQNAERWHIEIVKRKHAERHREEGWTYPPAEGHQNDDK